MNKRTRSKKNFRRQERKKLLRSEKEMAVSGSRYVNNPDDAITQAKLEMTDESERILYTDLLSRN